MRGIQMDETTMYNFDRIIPAHAGNTGRVGADRQESKDHPRSCGEYWSSLAPLLSHLGSSPLMRGILRCLARSRCRNRIIPAHAGNTLPPSHIYLLLRDHPRSCGEYPPITPILSRYLGSSPLMRGILMMFPPCG